MGYHGESRTVQDMVSGGVNETCPAYSNSSGV